MKALFSSFYHISLAHISRSFNYEAKYLSKKGLLIDECYMHFQEFFEEVLIDEGVELMEKFM